jgi:hypothetical protein
MRTGMEPFFEFCSAVIYAATQIRIEWRAMMAYRRNLSPRNANSESARLVNGGFPQKEQLL